MPPTVKSTLAVLVMLMPAAVAAHTVGEDSSPSTNAMNRRPCPILVLCLIFVASLLLMYWIFGTGFDIWESPSKVLGRTRTAPLAQGIGSGIRSIGPSGTAGRREPSSVGSELTATVGSRSGGAASARVALDQRITARKRTKPCWPGATLLSSVQRMCV